MPCSSWLANRPTALLIEAVLSLAKLGHGAGVWKYWVNERGPVVLGSDVCYWSMGVNDPTTQARASLQKARGGGKDV